MCVCVFVPRLDESEATLALRAPSGGATMGMRVSRESHGSLVFASEGREGIIFRGYHELVCLYLGVTARWADEVLWGCNEAVIREL